MIPTQGRMVRVLGVHSNGSDEQAAMITAAFSNRDTRDGAIAVNLMVFPDLGAPTTLSSIMLFDTREQALAWRGENRWAHAAFWPEAVPPAAEPVRRVA